MNKVNAFIAWTPLHVINIINTVVNFFPQKQNDFYLYNEFDHADEIYQAVKQQNIFDNVYLVSYDQMGNLLEKGFSMLCNKQKFVRHNAIYTDIFIQGGNYFSKILYGETKKLNEHVKLHYIEDGLGAYVGSPIIRLDTPGKKMVKALNRHSMYHADIDSFFVYEPTLLETKAGINYKKLPKLTTENPALNAIKKVFSMGSEPASGLTGKVLYFDQPFLADGFTIDEMETMAILEKLVPADRLVTKLHPRSRQDKYGEKSILGTNLPWELFCLNNSLEDVFLISVATTASFTPYLMFGKKLPVILMAQYYLAKNKNEAGNQKTIALLENVIRFAALFAEKTGMTVHMPKTVDELGALVGVGPERGVI